MDKKPEKLRVCQIQIRKAYTGYRRVPYLLETEKVSSTDGTFLQIGNRIPFEKYFFEEEGPEFICGPLGTMVARGEEEYLLRNLIEAGEVIKKIQPEQIDFGFLTPIILDLSVDPDEISIVIPANRMGLIYNNFGYRNIIYSDSCKCHLVGFGEKNIRVFFGRGKDFPEKLLIFRRDCGFWYSQTFHDEPESKLAPTLSIETKEMKDDPFKMEMLVRSIIKLEIKRKNDIRIFDLD